MFFKQIIRVIKATFPSSPEERNFIKDLKWPKLITDFLKTFEYTYSIQTTMNIKCKMFQETLH